MISFGVDDLTLVGEWPNQKLPGRWLPECACLAETVELGAESSGPACCRPHFRHAPGLTGLCKSSVGEIKARLVRRPRMACFMDHRDGRRSVLRSVIRVPRHELTMSIARSANLLGGSRVHQRGIQLRCGGGCTHILRISLDRSLVVDLQAGRTIHCDRTAAPADPGRASILAGTLAPGVGLAAQNREFRQFTGRSAAMHDRTFGE